MYICLHYCHSATFGNGHFANSEHCQQQQEPYHKRKNTNHLLLPSRSQPLFLSPLVGTTLCSHQHDCSVIRWAHDVVKWATYVRWTHHHWQLRPSTTDIAQCFRCNSSMVHSVLKTPTHLPIALPCCFKKWLCFSLVWHHVGVGEWWGVDDGWCCEVPIVLYVKEAKLSQNDKWGRWNRAVNCL